MIDNDKLTQQISSISNSEIENYNIQDEIYKFTESVNSEILKYNDKIFAKNQSELLSLLTMIKDYKAPIQFGNNVTLPKMWFDNPTLKQYATDKFQEFETLTNPETNTKLQATNIVDSNLTTPEKLWSERFTISDFSPISSFNSSMIVFAICKTFSYLTIFSLCTRSVEHPHIPSCARFCKSNL